jgi:hypothetical protein
MKRKSAILLAPIFALAGLLSMSIAPGATGASAQEEDKASVRVVHTSVDASAVDVYIDGNKAFSDLSFKGVSDWASIPPGTHKITATPAGKTETLFEAMADVEPGKAYTIVAGGELANMLAKVLEDNLDTLPAGKARLRLVHASPDTPAVDIDLNNGVVLVPNIGFLDSSSYLEMDAATPVDVKLRPAGTRTVAFSAPGVKLDAGKVYTFIVVGQSQGEPPLSVVTVTADARQPTAMSQVMPASGPSAPPSNAPMPTTGAGDTAANLALVAVMLAALCSISTGAALRRGSE